MCSKWDALKFFRSHPGVLLNLCRPTVYHQPVELCRRDPDLGWVRSLHLSGSLLPSRTHGSTLEWWTESFVNQAIRAAFWVRAFGFPQVGAQRRRFPLLPRPQRSEPQRSEPQQPHLLSAGEERLGPLCSLLLPGNWVTSHHPLLSPPFTLALCLLHPVLRGPCVCRILCWF